MNQPVSPPSHGFRALLPVAVLGLLACLLVVLALYMGDRIGRRHALLIDAVMEIKLEATTAHLWLEEIINGDRHESMDLVHAHLDQADWYARVMLEGGENSEGRFQPLQDAAMRGEVMQIRARIAELGRLTEQRLAAGSASVAGSEIDQQYDTLFRGFLGQADAVEAQLQTVMDDELVRFNALQLLFLVLILVATATAWALVHRNHGRWKRHVLELQAAQHSAHCSEERLRILINSIPDLVWLKDANGVYLACNKLVERFFGASESEIIGRTDYDFVDRALADFFRARDQAAISANAPLQNEEWITQADNGQRVLLATTKIPVHDDDGALIGVFGIGRDITAIRESQRSMDSFFRAAPIGIGLVVDRVFHEVNDTFCNMTGYSREELLGQSSRIIYPSDEEFERVGRVKYAQIRETGRGSIETRFQRRDGKLIEVLLSSSLLEVNEPDHGNTFTALDITERKRAETELKQQFSELLRWQDATLGREDRVRELKCEVNSLLKDQGRAPRYPSVAGEDNNLA